MESISNSGYGCHFDSRRFFTFLVHRACLFIFGTVNRSKIASVLHIHAFDQLGLKWWLPRNITQTPKLMKYYLAVRGGALWSLERLQESSSVECGYVSWILRTSAQLPELWMSKCCWMQNIFTLKFPRGFLCKFKIAWHLSQNYVASNYVWKNT